MNTTLLNTFSNTAEFKKMEEIATGYILHGKEVPSMKELYFLAQEALIKISTKENINGLSDRVYERLSRS